MDVRGRDEEQDQRGGAGGGGRNGSQDSTELVQVESHLLPLNLAQELGGRDTGVTIQASRSLD